MNNLAKMKIPRTTLILSIVIIGGAAFFFYNSLSSKQTPKNSTQTERFVTENTDFTPYSEREWLTYTDKEFGYQIDYPTGLNTLPIESSDTDPTRVTTFTRNIDSYGIMSVKIYTDNNITTLDEWLIFQNQRNRGRVDLEKSIIIDGHEAWTTYSVSVTPEFEERFIQEKKTALFKDGTLFEIWTRFYDDETSHAKAWDSFKFFEATSQL